MLFNVKLYFDLFVNKNYTDSTINYYLGFLCFLFNPSIRSPVDTKLQDSSILYFINFEFGYYSFYIKKKKIILISEAYPCSKIRF
jgi:hypothetical protein